MTVPFSLSMLASPGRLCLPLDRNVFETPAVFLQGYNYLLFYCRIWIVWSPGRGTGPTTRDGEWEKWRQCWARENGVEMHHSMAAAAAAVAAFL